MNNNWERNLKNDDEINECSDDNIFNFNDQTGRYTTKLFYETINENGIIDVEQIVNVNEYL